MSAMTLPALIPLRLDALESVPLSQISTADARHILIALDEAAKMQRQQQQQRGVSDLSIDPSHDTGDSSSPSVAPSERGSSKAMLYSRAASDANEMDYDGALSKSQRALVSLLTEPQQNTLMRVLYACMASCATTERETSVSSIDLMGATEVERTSASLAVDVTSAPDIRDTRHVPHPSLSPPQVRRLYMWHEAVYDAVGDGAILRTLTRR